MFDGYEQPEVRWASPGKPTAAPAGAHHWSAFKTVLSAPSSPTPRRRSNLQMMLETGSMTPSPARSLGSPVKPGPRRRGAATGKPATQPGPFDLAAPKVGVADRVESASQIVSASRRVTSVLVQPASVDAPRRGKKRRAYGAQRKPDVETVRRGLSLYVKNKDGDGMFTWDLAASMANQGRVPGTDEIDRSYLISQYKTFFKDRAFQSKTLSDKLAAIKAWGGPRPSGRPKKPGPYTASTGAIPRRYRVDTTTIADTCSGTRRFSDALLAGWPIAPVVVGWRQTKPNRSRGQRL